MRTTTTKFAQYTTCNAAGVCNYGSVGLIADDSSSTYHALQVAFSRQYAHGLSFLASYWYSKSLDYISSLNVAGSAPTLVAGENDLAQNPFDLRAEHGPSLFDARQRFVFSGSLRAAAAGGGASRGRGISRERLATQYHRQSFRRARRLPSTTAPTSPCRAARPKSAASTPAVRT